MRPQREQSKESNGSQNCSDRFAEDLADQKKERKTWIGY